MVNQELNLLAKALKISMVQANNIQQQILRDKAAQNKEALLTYLNNKGFFKEGIYYIPQPFQNYFRTEFVDEKEQKNEHIQFTIQNLESSLITIKKFLGDDNLMEWNPD